MDYSDFLKKKEFIVRPSGFEVEDKDINPMLFDFQKDLIKWALRLGKAAIWAGCGLGKTPMQLEWAKHVYEKTSKNVLILAPLAVSKQTVREGKKFKVDVNLCEYDKDVREGISITNYQKLHKFDIDRFDAVVLDESSVLKDYTSKYRNYIIKLFNNTQYKLACSATPAPNDYMEIGNHAEFLNVMSRLEMLAMFFIHDSSRTSDWRLKKHGEDAFWKWLASWAVYLEKPSDLGYDDNGFVLPELKYHYHKVDYSDSSLGLFGAVNLDLNKYREVRRNSVDSRVAKAKELLDQNPCIVWCDLNIEGDTFEKSVKNAVQVSGSDSDEIKEKRMLDFTDKKIPILVSKPSIAGHGMNWQHCNNVIFLGLGFSFEMFYQAVRRCWRFGQKKPVNVHIITTDKEQSVLEVMHNKQKKANELLKGMLNHMSIITKKALKNLKREDAKYMHTIKKDEYWEAYNGDCVEVLKGFEESSIDYSIFSPPFSHLYTYSDHLRDMGNSKNHKEFVEHFKFFIELLYKVMKQGRLVSVHCSDLPVTKQVDGFVGKYDFTGELIRLFVEQGFIYHTRVTIWKNPATEMQRTKSIGLLHKQLCKDSSMSRMGGPDYIVTFRKPGDNLNPIKHNKSDFPVEQWRIWASPVWMDINQSDTLNFKAARDSKDERHICPLQLPVIERCLVLWSNVGDTVLSPFAGIGSEGYMSLKKGRKFIGIELKESYYNVMLDNLKSVRFDKTGKGKKGFFS